VGNFDAILDSAQRGLFDVAGGYYGDGVARGVHVQGGQVDRAAPVSGLGEGPARPQHGCGYQE
jgi:hypothetical protein